MSEYRWLNDASLQFLQNGYLLPNQTVDERVTIIAEYAENILKIPGFADKFKSYVKKGWFSLSTPIWANFGTNRGLGISCFGSYISDTMESILATHAEVAMMTKYGGGTSAYFGNLRPRGSPITNNGTSSGAVHFMRLFDNMINVVGQGSTRRGNFAAYLPIDHPDIEEFLTLRTEGNPIQDISFGVCVPEGWMQSMIDGDEAKRKIWAKIIQLRINTGYPYIFFGDNTNNNTVEVYKDNKLTITHSNLCQEICLPDNDSMSFICCLMSMNVAYYDEWKDTDAVETAVYFLDSVIEDFIRRAHNLPYMKRAVKFAREHRALGLGWLGWHTLLQSKMIPFESMEAKTLTGEIAKLIKEKAYTASGNLAKIYGAPELLRKYGRRNSTLLAIAPTKSSSFILGQVSEGIEPIRSNYYIKDLQKGKFTTKNKHLQEILAKYNKDTDEVWESIMRKHGSVQHLDFLSKREKDVFKTFPEISQMEVVIQASIRQKYIDQGQSLNLMIHPKTSPKDINTLMIEAWKLGIKGLYYQIGVNAAQEFSKNILSCSSCEA